MLRSGEHLLLASFLLASFLLLVGHSRPKLVPLERGPFAALSMVPRAQIAFCWARLSSTRPASSNEQQVAIF